MFIKPMKTYIGPEGSFYADTVVEVTQEKFEQIRKKTAARPVPAPWEMAVDCELKKIDRLDLKARQFKCQIDHLKQAADQARKSAEAYTNLTKTIKGKKGKPSKRDKLALAANLARAASDNADADLFEYDADCMQKELDKTIMSIQACRNKLQRRVEKARLDEAARLAKEAEEGNNENTGENKTQQAIETESESTSAKDDHDSGRQAAEAES